MAKRNALKELGDFEKIDNSHVADYAKLIRLAQADPLALFKNEQQFI